MMAAGSTERTSSDALASLDRVSRSSWARATHGQGPGEKSCRSARLQSTKLAREVGVGLGEHLKLASETVVALVNQRELARAVLQLHTTID